MRTALALPTVAVIRTRPETVLDDYARLLALAGLDAPPAGGAVLDLCLDREPGPAARLPAAASPPWQLEGLLRALLAAGWPAAQLAVRAPGGEEHAREPARSWAAVLAACGIPPLGAGAVARPDGPPRLLAASLRTQCWLGLSGCLGVLAADLLGTGALADLDRRPDRLVTAWRDLAAAGPLRGGVLDATVCGDGDAPSALIPISAHLLLAGTDPVAVDTIAAGLIGLVPARLPLLQAAQQAGLGCAEPARIRLVGDRVERLPALGLQAAVRYRGPRPARDHWWGRWRGRWLAAGEPFARLAALRARRRREQHETSPWGRLRRHYQDERTRIGGAA